VSEHGVYIINALSSFNLSSIGVRYGRILINSTLNISGSSKDASANSLSTCSFSGEVELFAGDIIEFQVFHDTGAPLALRTNSSENWITISKKGN